MRIAARYVRAHSRVGQWYCLHSPLEVFFINHEQVLPWNYVKNTDTPPFQMQTAIAVFQAECDSIRVVRHAVRELPLPVPNLHGHQGTRCSVRRARLSSLGSFHSVHFTCGLTFLFFLFPFLRPEICQPCVARYGMAW